MLPAMKRETVLALNALNRAFYEAIAPEWSESRRHPWPGFERVLSLSSARADGPPRERLRVLDVGAGDGRFAAFLQTARHSEPFEYLGIDASESLLARAHSRGLDSNVRFENRDFLAGDDALPSAQFDLVVLFGVLHHVPAFERRCQLLVDLAQRVAAGGLFALTFWRLDRDARFTNRVRSFAEYNARATEPIAASDLEPGDVLLSWGDRAALRYCHFPDARETEALIAATGLPVVARFDADGRGDALNEYVVFQRT
jgi:tRNA (uracil-5-)-methyltransferase TRM9